MDNLQTIEHQGKRVLTTQQLAQVYETDVKNIQMNYANNESRFQSGRDYYFLKGEDLKNFKNSLPNIIGEPSIKFAPQLYLWTERGANRHCKILDTDKAWEQFDVLEESYFNTKVVQQLPQIEIDMIAMKYTTEILRPSEAGKLRMLETVCKNHNVNTNFLPKYTEEKITKSATELLKEHGSPMSAHRFNQAMIEEGFLEEKQRNGENTSWECAWYNNTIVRADLIKIKIEYTDGTTEQLSGDQIKYVKF